MTLDCHPWGKFVSSTQLEESGYVPSVVMGRGCYRRIAIPREKIQCLAFDEEDGHISLRKQHVVGFVMSLSSNSPFISVFKSAR